MIINTKDKHSKFFTHSLLIFTQSLLEKLFYRKKNNQLYKDSEQLNHYFRNHYPSFKKNVDGNISCVSCDLCQSACPAEAIKVEKANLMNFPHSLKSGEVPLRFYLDTELCTKCRLCADVCLVDAIEMRGEYPESRVDLVSFEINKKAVV